MDKPENLLKDNFTDYSIVPLSGGHMSEVYLVKSNTESFVAKVLTDSSSEESALISLQVLNFIPKYRGTIVFEGLRFILIDHVENSREVRYLLQGGFYSHGLSEFGTRAAQMLMDIQLKLPGRSHGDFTTKNILFNGSNYFVIDFEAASFQDSKEDVAWFVWYNSFHHPKESTQINESFLANLPFIYSKSTLKNIVTNRIKRIVRFMDQKGEKTALANWYSRLEWTINNFMMDDLKEL